MLQRKEERKQSHKLATIQLRVTWQCLLVPLSLPLFLSVALSCFFSPSPFFFLRGCFAVPLPLTFQRKGRLKILLRNTLGFGKEGKYAVSGEGFFPRMVVDGKGCT
jgi:hypothetical protein